MKAVLIEKYGGVEVLEMKENIAVPSVKKEQVLVEVYAVSINPVDWKIREGCLQSMMPITFPATIGGDFAGKVKEVGEDVADISAGDDVYGSAIVLNGGSGAFAEYAVVNTGNIAAKPTSVDFVKAAALPLTGSSAIQALEDHMKLQAGSAFAKASADKKKVLIHGGAGGIGTIAIQLAKTIGAYVATTVSTDDKEYVMALGADEVIDYKQQKFEEMLKDFDAVYDTVGGETTDKSFKVLKKGGIIVSMLGQPNPELAKQYEVTAIGQGTQTNTQHLRRLAELIDSGKITVHVEKVFPFAQVKEAFTYQETSHPRGKVVLTIKDINAS